jgi:hypothetical protein
VKYIISGDVVLSRPPEGPRAAQVGAFAKWANEQGYAYSRYRQGAARGVFQSMARAAGHQRTSRVIRAALTISAMSRSTRAASQG